MPAQIKSPAPLIRWLYHRYYDPIGHSSRAWHTQKEVFFKWGRKAKDNIAAAGGCIYEIEALSFTLHVSRAPTKVARGRIITPLALDFLIVENLLLSWTKSYYPYKLCFARFFWSGQWNVDYGNLNNLLETGRQWSIMRCSQPWSWCWGARGFIILAFHDFGVAWGGWRRVHRA